MKILLSAIAALFLIGCGSQNKQEAQEVVKETKTEVVQNVKETQSEISQKAVDVKTEVVQKSQGVISDVADTTQEVKDEVSQKVEDVITEVSAKTEAAEDVKEAVSESQIDAAAVYKVCAGCHGADGSKVALGKSQVIKGWDAKKIEDALLGYKNKTYGGVMKCLMTSQVSSLSDEEIKAVSEYISTF